MWPAVLEKSQPPSPLNGTVYRVKLVLFRIYPHKTFRKIKLTMQYQNLLVQSADWKPPLTQIEIYFVLFCSPSSIKLNMYFNTKGQKGCLHVVFFSYTYFFYNNISWYNNIFKILFSKSMSLCIFIKTNLFAQK